MQVLIKLDLTKGSAQTKAAVCHARTTGGKPGSFHRLSSEPAVVAVMPVVAEEVMRRRRSRGRREPVAVEWHRDVAEAAAGERQGRWRRALVALGEEAEGVDLADEVCHARPAAEAEADHQHPRHHERVDHVRARPTPQQPRRRLHRVLHRARGSNQKLISYSEHANKLKKMLRRAFGYPDHANKTQTFLLKARQQTQTLLRAFDTVCLLATVRMFHVCLFLLSMKSTNACCSQSFISDALICLGGRRPNFCGTRRLDMPCGGARYKYFLQIKHLCSGSRVLSVCLHALRQPFSSFLLVRSSTHRTTKKKDSLALPLCFVLYDSDFQRSVRTAFSGTAFRSLIISALIIMAASDILPC
jgi:hypothetical protein